MAAMITDAKREMTAAKRFLNFPVKNGAHKCFINIAADGVTLRDFDIELADSEPDCWAFLDIAEFKGRTLTLTVSQIAEDSSGLKNIGQTDTIRGEANLYREALRPQFHFTSRRGWLNDPNGLAYYKGKWHLFYQHNPYGWNWGNMHWGHAVSTDLFHWCELDDALYPDARGTMFSGSAVVDHDNSAGLQRGSEKTLVAFYTAAGGCSRQNQGVKFSQCMAYSTDAGKTWTKYAENPVVPNIPEDIGGNRDPKVIWHEATRQWLMAIYVGLRNGGKMDDKDKPVKTDGIDFFASKDLKHWAYQSRTAGFYECPDIFELPVDGNPADTRWVLYGADGRYAIGRFDGRQFIPDGDKKPLWVGRFYAAQTYDNAPDGRRVQIGWAKGITFPGMAFNQQMNVPVDLTLRKTPDGIRMFAWPVRELDILHRTGRTTTNVTLKPGGTAKLAGGGELLDIDAEFAVGSAAKVALHVRGTPVVWDAAAKELSCGNEKASLSADNGTIHMRILVDRSSTEIFCNNGLVAISAHTLHDADNLTLSALVEGGSAILTRLEIHDLRPVWSGTENT